MEIDKKIIVKLIQVLEDLKKSLKDINIESKDSIIEEEIDLSNKIGIKVDFFQSNIEGEIVTKIQDARKEHDGIIVNAAGYTHTSVSIRDALEIFKKPIIELHISNIYKREEFRQKSLISNIATGIICGLGSNGYILAINAMHELLKDGNR